MTTTVERPARGISRKAATAGWILGILPCLALMASAAMKFAHPANVVESFQRFGYPGKLLPILGVVELTCTIIYLIPRTAVLGAILLTGYLGGATATHARVLDPAFISPIVCGVLLWLGLLLRDLRIRELLPLTRRASVAP